VARSSTRAFEAEAKLSHAIIGAATSWTKLTTVAQGAGEKLVPMFMNVVLTSDKCAHSVDLHNIFLLVESF